MDEQTTQQAQQQAQPQPEQQAAQPQPEQQAQSADQTDIENNKIMGILAYIFFLIPLLAAKESKFARYHTNQGLVLFLSVVGVYVVGGILPLVGILLIVLGKLAFLVLMVLGIINAAKGEMKPLPVIGTINLLK